MLHLESDDLKRKMYSCVLVVGGGSMFPGIHTWLQNRLSVQIPVVYRAEQMDIITRPKASGKMCAFTLEVDVHSYSYLFAKATKRRLPDH